MLELNKDNDYKSLIERIDRLEKKSIELEQKICFLENEMEDLKEFKQERNNTFILLIIIIISTILRRY